MDKMQKKWCGFGLSFSDLNIKSSIAGTKHQISVFMWKVCFTFNISLSEKKKKKKKKKKKNLTKPVSPPIQTNLRASWSKWNTWTRVTDTATSQTKFKTQNVGTR